MADIRQIILAAEMSLYHWMNSVVRTIQRPVGINFRIEQQPLWVHLSALFGLILIIWGVFPYSSHGNSSPLGTTMDYDVQNATKVPVTLIQMPYTTEVPITLIQMPYAPAGSRVVAEIYFLVAEISKQTARSPRAQSLYEYIDSQKGSGTGQSDSTPPEKLYSACTDTESRRTGTSEV